MAFGALLETTGAASIVDKIDATRRVGHLSQNEAILLKVQYMKNPESLPAGYISDETLPERCGSRVTLEVLRNWNSYSTFTQATLAAALARPAQQKSYPSPDGYFLIHYDTAGPNAVPLDDDDFSEVPDYVENLALYSDSSWRTEVLQLGYLPPPSDGDARYDIYTQEISFYGYAQPENPGPAAWGDFSSYIVVHRDFFGFPPNNDPEGNQKGAMKATIAHEFHHAVQFAYSVSNQTWFYEVTATWMENVVFDDVDDNYNYLSSFFNQPALPLTNESIHMYGSFIWNEFLAQNFGPDLIRQAWQANISTPATTSLNNILTGRGTSLKNEFARFTLWNYYTGGRNDGNHYEEGSFYPPIAMHSNSGGPIISGNSPALLPLASRYESFSSNSSIEKIRLTFSGATGSIWDAHVLLDGPPGIRSNPLFLASNRTGDTTVFGVDSFSTVVLIGAQTRISQLTSSTAFGYSYQSFPFYLLGDLNEDGAVTSLDVVQMLNYVFLGTLFIESHLEAADLDCSGAATSTDVVLLLNYVFLGQPPSCSP